MANTNNAPSLICIESTRVMKRAANTLSPLAPTRRKVVIYILLCSRQHARMCNSSDMNHCLCLFSSWHLYSSMNLVGIVRRQRLLLHTDYGPSIARGRCHGERGQQTVSRLSENLSPRQVGVDDFSGPGHFALRVSRVCPFATAPLDPGVPGPAPGTGSLCSGHPPPRRSSTCNTRAWEANHGFGSGTRHVGPCVSGGLCSGRGPCSWRRSSRYPFGYFRYTSSLSLAVKNAAVLTSICSISHPL